MKHKKNLDILLSENIRESFLHGTFHFGEKIDIDRLAEEYNVSRTPVVQALHRLECEGRYVGDRSDREVDCPGIFYSDRKRNL